MARGGLPFQILIKKKLNFSYPGTPRLAISILNYTQSHLSSLKKEKQTRERTLEIKVIKKTKPKKKGR